MSRTNIKQLKGCDVSYECGAIYYIFPAALDGPIQAEASAKHFQRLHNSYRPWTVLRAFRVPVFPRGICNEGEYDKELS